MSPRASAGYTSGGPENDDNVFRQLLRNQTTATEDDNVNMVFNLTAMLACFQIPVQIVVREHNLFEVTPVLKLAASHGNISVELLSEYSHNLSVPLFEFIDCVLKLEVPVNRRVYLKLLNASSISLFLQSLFGL
jgi:hypothetical protein